MAACCRRNDYRPAFDRDRIHRMTRLTRHAELLILCARIGYNPPTG